MKQAKGSLETFKKLNPTASFRIPANTEGKKIVYDTSNPLWLASEIFSKQTNLISKLGKDASDLQAKIKAWGNLKVDEVHKLKSYLWWMSYKTTTDGTKIKQEGIADAHSALWNELEKLLGKGYTEGNKKVQLGIWIQSRLAKGEKYTKQQIEQNMSNALAYWMATWDLTSAAAYGWTKSLVDTAFSNPYLKTLLAKTLTKKVKWPLEVAWVKQWKSLLNKFVKPEGDITNTALYRAQNKKPTFLLPQRSSAPVVTPQTSEAWVVMESYKPVKKVIIKKK